MTLHHIHKCITSNKSKNKKAVVGGAFIFKSTSCFTYKKAWLIVLVTNCKTNCGDWMKNKYIQHVGCYYFRHTVKTNAQRSAEVQMLNISGLNAQFCRSYHHVVFTHFQFKEALKQNFK